MVRYCSKCKKELGAIHKANSFVCFDCKLKTKKECDRKYREQQGDKLREKKKEQYYKGSIRKCALCSKEFERANWNKTKYCSRDCFHKESKTSRQLDGNPTWKNGASSQAYNKMYFDHKYKTTGMLPHEIGCEVCGIMSGVIFDRHHIIFKSEMGYHKEINNPINIIQACRSCHLKFHGKKSRRNYLIEERNLTELFGNSIL